MKQKIKYFLMTVVVLITNSVAAVETTFDIATIEKLGRIMYSQDLVAAKATDILFKQNLDLKNYPMGGWVVSNEGDHFLVTFIADYPSGPSAVFEIRPNQKDNQFRQLEKSELSAELLSQYKARKLAIKSIDQSCSTEYNTVVIKEQDTGNQLVYALAATKDANAVPIGGHYRFRIDANGDQILKKDKLFSNCLTLSKTPSEIPKGAILKALTVNHVLSDMPYETDVFQNLLHKIDFIVITNDKTVWKIANGEITNDLEMTNAVKSK